MTNELPDGFEVRQAREMGQALAAGDLDRAEQLRRHLVSEAARDDGDEAELDAVSRASALFRQHLDAREAGDTEQAARLMNELATDFSRATQTTVLCSAFLRTGMARGWLPAGSHDILTTWAGQNVADPDITTIISQIERR